MSDDSGSSFTATFFGALEGSISVLLTLLAGYLAARKGMIDRASVHHVSNLCSMLFLPMLIIVEMGPELTVEQLRRLWILPVWGFVSTLLAHLVGWVGCKLFKTRSWVIVACGRPNSSALPLLLLKALSQTGVLQQFSNGDEDSDKLLTRAQSLILLNVVVQQTLTFQIAPWLIKKDAKAEGKRLDEDEDIENAPPRLTPSSPGAHTSNINPIVQDRERVGLLEDHDGRNYGTREGRDGTSYSRAMEPIADQPDVHWPHSIQFLEKPIKKTWGMMSPPLIGAIIALLLGVCMRLHTFGHC
jgi:auxin efflux carrier family protein